MHLKNCNWKKPRAFTTATIPGCSSRSNELYDQKLAEVKRGVNTYWLSQPLSTELTQKHNIFLDGGDQYMRYAVDASYNKNTGVMKGSSRQVLSGGVNLAYRKDALQFTNYLSVTSNKSVNSPYGDFSDYARLNPYYRVRDSWDAFPRYWKRRTMIKTLPV